MPSSHIIKGLAGVLDFYVINGVPIVRRWPKKYHGPKSHKMTCNQQRFRDFQKGLPYWTRTCKKLAQHASLHSGWRWNDYAYKLYMGRVPYARLYTPPEEWQFPKPCPDEVGRFFINHHAFIQCWRRPDYPEDHPLFPGERRHLNDLIFWVSAPNVRMKMYYDYSPPLMAAHWKTQRGVRKQCGWEPTGFKNPREAWLDTSYYNESPGYTHGTPLSHISVPRIYDEWWGYIEMDEDERPWWTPRNSYSVGPMFHFDWPGAPDMDVGDKLFHHLEPLHQIQWKGLKPWSWMTWNRVKRYVEVWGEMTWVRPPEYDYRVDPWYWW